MSMFNSNFISILGPAGVLPKISIDSKKIAVKLAKIKDKTDTEENVSLSQMEKDENVLSKEELIDQNKAWKALENDDLFNANSRFNTEHIKKEAIEGMAIKVPIFFGVLKSIGNFSWSTTSHVLLIFKLFPSGAEA